MNQVAEKLRQARALIERGWTQGWFVSSDGLGVCPIGAINKVYIGHATFRGGESAKRLLRKAIGCPCIAPWNDAPERTQAEVLAAFDKAIELAESGQ